MSRNYRPPAWAIPSHNIVLKTELDGADGGGVGLSATKPSSVHSGNAKESVLHRHAPASNGSAATSTAAQADTPSASAAANQRHPFLAASAHYHSSSHPLSSAAVNRNHLQQATNLVQPSHRHKSSAVAGVPGSSMDGLNSSTITDPAMDSSPLLSAHTSSATSADLVTAFVASQTPSSSSSSSFAVAAQSAAGLASDTGPVQTASMSHSKSESTYFTLCRAIEELLSSHVPLNPVSMARIQDYCQRVHLQLIKNRSRQSRTITRTLGLKRKIAEYQAREVIRDRRFTRSFTLDKLQPSMQPSLIIHLFPNHFKLDNCDDVFTYDGPLRSLLDALYRRTLIPDVLDMLDHDSCTFYDGAILVEVHDHRSANRSSSQAPLDTSAQIVSTMSETHRILLLPTNETIMADMNLLFEKFQGRLGEDDLYQIESKILLTSENNICLDPSFEVCRISGFVEFNKSLFLRHEKQRTTDFGERNPLPTEQDQTPLGDMERLLFISTTESKRSTRPSFRQSSFMEEWRKARSLADNSPSLGLDKIAQGKASNIRRNSRGQLVQLVRTLKFVRQSGNQEPIHTCLNISQSMDGSYEALLRWGTQPDRSVGGKTLKFKLQDATMMDGYVRSFLATYCQAEGHQLTLDQRANFDSIAQLTPQISTSQQPRRKTTVPPNTAAASNTRTALTTSAASTPIRAHSPPPNEASPQQFGLPSAAGSPSAISVSTPSDAQQTRNSQMKAQTNSAKMQQSFQSIQQNRGRQRGPTPVGGNIPISNSIGSHFSVSAQPIRQQPITSQASSAASPPNAGMTSGFVNNAQSPPNHSPATAHSPSTHAPTPQTGQSPVTSLNPGNLSTNMSLSQDALMKIMALPPDQVPESLRQLYNLLKWRNSQAQALRSQALTAANTPLMGNLNPLMNQNQQQPVQLPLANANQPPQATQVNNNLLLALMNQQSQQQQRQAAAAALQQNNFQIRQNQLQQRLQMTNQQNQLRSLPNAAGLSQQSLLQLQQQFLAQQQLMNNNAALQQQQQQQAQQHQQQNLAALQQALLSANAQGLQAQPVTQSFGGLNLAPAQLQAVLSMSNSNNNNSNANSLGHLGQPQIPAQVGQNSGRAAMMNAANATSNVLQSLLNQGFNANQIALLMQRNQAPVDVNLLRLQQQQLLQQQQQGQLLPQQQPQPPHPPQRK